MKAVTRLALGFGLVIASACSNGGGSATVTIGLPGREELTLRAAPAQNANNASDANTAVGGGVNPNATSNPNAVANGNNIGASPNAIGANDPNLTPSNRVDAYAVRAHASDMVTVNGNTSVDANSISLNVPAGKQRVIEVMALRIDTNPPLPTYFGSDTLDLAAGTDVPVDMEIAPAGLLQGVIAVTSSEQKLMEATLQAIPVSGGRGPIELGLDSNAFFSQPLPVGAYILKGSVSLDGLAGTLQGNPNFVIRQGVPTTLRVYVQLPGKCDPAKPLDHDGDGVACDKDCDDTDVNNWDGCKACVDTDNDHWRSGCDAYRTILGPDCDDKSPNSWDTCKSCLDLDGDGRYSGCNVYATVSGPDCNDADRSNWKSCATCVDKDRDGSYANCDAYFNRHGPDCNDNDINNWISCAYCQDYDGDKHYVSCDQYASIEPDCNDFDKFNWASCATCKDDDYDGAYVGCDAYARIGDANFVVQGPDCNDRFDGCDISCANDCVAKSIGFAALAGDDSITVKWLPILNARTYNVYVSTDYKVGPGNLSGGFMLPHAHSPFVIHGVHNATTYYVVLSDIDNTGKETVDAGPVMVSPHNAFESIMQVAAGNVHSVALKADGSVWAWGSNPNGQIGLPNVTTQPIPAVVPLAAHFVQVAAGLNHTLALDDAGTVWAWGENSLSQLGTTGSPSKPQQVSLPAAITAIAAGDNHSLALDASGNVWGWGANSNGQIGNNANNLSVSTPTQLTGAFGSNIVVSISAAGNHSLAVDRTQGGWSWGDNSLTQTGLGVGTIFYKVPTKLSSLANVRGLFATRNGGFALAGNANTYQWGNNTYGQLGTGGGSNLPLNFQYAPPGAWTFSGSLHTLAVDSQGRVSTFGNNASKQLGRTPGAGQDSNVIALANIPGVRAVATGSNHSLAITLDGSVLAWGDNSAGQVGIGPSQSQVSMPTKVGSVIKIATGAGHSVALNSDGSVWVWGSNYYGQLASDTASASYIPNRVNLPLAAVDIASGSGHVLALTADGNVWAWGENDYSQLGNAMIRDGSSGTPSVVPGLPPIRGVAAGGYFSVAVDNTNNVWGWGENYYHELGTSQSTELPPTQISGIGNVQKLAAGEYHVLALKTDGSVWAWGENSYSQLGGTPSQDGRPLKVIASGIVDIAAGTTHSVALESSGYVDLWGGNGYGEAATGNPGGALATPTRGAALSGTFTRISAGNNTSTVVNAGSTQVYGKYYYGEYGTGSPVNQASSGTLGPVLLPTTPQVLSIGSESSHMFAVMADGTVWSWGYSVYGALGRPDDGSGSSPMPAPVVFDRRPTQVAAGNGFSVAVVNDGTVATWGDNSVGTLGVGLGVSRATYPVPVTYVTAPIRQLVAANQHAMAIDANGSIWVWGNNTRGQLGDNSSGVRSIPHRQNIYDTSVYTMIATGGDHGIAVNDSNYIFAWGANDLGQVGNSSTTDQPYPSYVTYGTDVRGVAASDCATYYWTGTGFYSWGCNGSGELGDSNPIDPRNYSQAPSTLISLKGIQTLCAGLHHALALLADGSVWAWGDDSQGQLGDNASTPQSTPQRVPNLPPIASIACGGNGSLVVGRNGGVFAWGTHPGWANQTVRKPASANTLTLSAPSILSTGRGVASAALSSTHLVLQNATGALVSSGLNKDGQLGNGTTTATTSPVFVQGL